MDPVASVQRFTLAEYIRTLTRLVGEPREYFSDRAGETGVRFPLTVLLVSALVSSGASVVGGRYPDPASMFGILFVNAVGMSVLAAGIGYMVMVMTLGRKAGFVGFLAVYALASGVTLLASWMPFFGIITEPWKWWLIGIGMTRSLGLTGRQALWIIAVSVGVIVLGFWSALPLFLHSGEGG